MINEGIEDKIPRPLSKTIIPITTKPRPNVNKITVIPVDDLGDLLIDDISDYLKLRWLYYNILSPVKYLTIISNRNRQ